MRYQIFKDIFPKEKFKIKNQYLTCSLKIAHKKLI
jgi:hypothetical protein